MAYTQAVTTGPMGKGAERISRSLGIFSGKCNVTDYDGGTLLEATGITRNFVAGNVSGYTHGIIAVMPQGLSDEGYEFKWDYTTGAFEAFYPTSMTMPVLSNTVGIAITWLSGAAPNQICATSSVGEIVIQGAAKEATGVTDVGEVSFIAIGFIR